MSHFTHKNNQLMFATCRRKLLLYADHRGWKTHCGRTHG